MKKRGILQKLISFSIVFVMLLEMLFPSGSVFSEKITVDRLNQTVRPNPTISSQGENLWSNVLPLNEDNQSEETEDIDSFNDESIQPAQLRGTPIIVSEENNYLRLDSSNETLKTPDDYAIGRKGQYEFSLSFKINPKDIPEEDRVDIYAEFTIPKGFQVVNIPNVTGVVFKQVKKPNGSSTVMATVDSSITSVIGQLRIRQNQPSALIGDLPQSKGTYNFDMMMYAHYGKSDQVEVLTASSGNKENKTDRLTLQADTSIPQFEITSASNGTLWYPGDVIGSKGQYNGGNASGSSDYLNILSKAANGTTKHTVDGKPFFVTYHKTAGYLTKDTIFKMVLPEENTKFLTDKGILYYRYVLDSGETSEWVGAGFNSTGALVGHPYVNSTTFTPRPLQFQDETEVVSGTRDYKSGDTGKTLSQTDFYYKPGTLEVYYNPYTYVNRLYEGDWDNTTYTALSGSTVTFASPQDGIEVKEEAQEPLIFKMVNGTRPIRLHHEGEVTGEGIGTVTQIPQYSSASPEYNDSLLMLTNLRFDNFDLVDNDFKFQKNLKVSYDYVEELNPVHLESLKTGKDYGFSYRIFVSDATTGQLSRVETLVDKETWDKGYNPMTFSGIMESAKEASEITEWDLAEANNAGNKLYVSKIEVFKEQYEYNHVLSNRYNQSILETFKYKLRAYDKRLSNGENIPDDYPAKIHREVTSDEIMTDNGGAFIKDYVIKTRELRDDFHAHLLNLAQTEINTHPDINAFVRLNGNKYSTTKSYNLDALGNTISYGEAGYNPATIEVSGDAITMVDFMDADKGYRLLGVYGDNDQYYDLTENGIDALSDEYVVSASRVQSNSMLSAYPWTDIPSDWNNDPRDSKLVKLKAIYDKLGVNFAKRLVVAWENINELKADGNTKYATMNFYAQKIQPGYLNYDALLGAIPTQNLNNSLAGYVADYSTYSDYKQERVDGTPLSDAQNQIGHGWKYKSTHTNGSALIVHGNYVEKIELIDEDYYVHSIDKPKTEGEYVYGKEVRGRYPDKYDPKVTTINTHGSQSGLHNSILTEIKVTRPATNIPQMQYQDASLDFTGSDPKLLSLVNSLAFKNPKIPGLNYPDEIHEMEIEYTLSNGEVKKVRDIMASDRTQGDYTWYMLPGVDIENNVYITSLKINYPNDLNWGENRLSYTANATYNNDTLHSVALACFNNKIPLFYPGTTERIGSISDNENDENYDKLTVKATMSFKNIVGETLSNDDSKYKVSGTSERIRATYAEFSISNVDVTYIPTSTNQGEDVTVRVSNQATATKETTPLLQSDNSIYPRPVYYYKINKDFTYVDGSIHPNARQGDMPEGSDVRFYPAGVGEGTSGSNDYGILKVSLENADITPTGNNNIDVVNAPRYNIYTKKLTFNYLWNFKLNVRYNAKPVTTIPIEGAWLDFPYDANRDNNSGNKQGMIIETSNDDNQLLDTAPLGDKFNNVSQSKNINNDAYAEMLYVDINTTNKIQEQAVQGAIRYVIATSPYSESTQKVTSRDIVAVDNLYSERVYITGDSTQKTKDWEIYVPITKKDENYKYLFAGQTKTTKTNEFSMDYLGIDTSDLDNKSLSYKVWYTTDANPAQGGYTGSTMASYKDIKTEPPVDLSAITMIKLTVDEVDKKEKSFFEIKYKLSKHKFDIGRQINETVGYANYHLGNDSDWYFGDNGQNFIPANFYLEDMVLSGFVWDESDYNSTYNQDMDTLKEGIELKLCDSDNKEVLQAKNSGRITGNNGKYQLIMPHDGKFKVEIVLPDGKGLVGSNVNGDASIDSAFDRSGATANLEFKADYAQAGYVLKNINAGIYTKPIITITNPDKRIHIKNQDDSITGTIENPAPGATLAIAQDSGYDEYSVVSDQGNSVAKVKPKKTGVVPVTFTTSDGYGGVISKKSTIIIYNKVKYDKNHDSVTGDVPVDGSEYYPSLTSGGEDANSDNVTVLDKGTLARSGYLFKGWNTQADGKGTMYNNGDKFKTGSLNDDTTLYAIWSLIWTQMEIPTRDVKVTKNWDMLGGNAITPQIDKINVELYKDGITTNKILELNESNHWTTTFEKLPVSATLGGTNHEYTVKEVGESGDAIRFGNTWFTVIYGGTVSEGFTITNKEKTLWTPMMPPTRNIKVVKDWKDSSGNSLNAPVDKIEVELYKDGVATEKKLELTKDNNWSGEFKNLEVADGLGSTNYYQYTVKEAGETAGSVKLDTKWFKVSYTGNMKDGFTITNQKEKAWIPLEPLIREIKVIKQWKDYKGNNINPPTDKITVELYKDSKSTGDILELNSNNNWSGVFKKLEVSDGVGSTDYYKYTVKEVNENGNIIEFDDKLYKVVYDGNMKDGFTITNEKEAPPTHPYTSVTPSNAEKPTITDASRNNMLPKTGEGANISLYSLLMFTSGVVLVIIRYKRKKYVK